MNNEDLVGSFEFRWDHGLGISTLGSHESSYLLLLEVSIEVVLSLLHGNLKGSELVVLEVDTRARQVGVDNLGEQ